MRYIKTIGNGAIIVGTDRGREYAVWKNGAVKVFNLDQEHEHELPASVRAEVLEATVRHMFTQKATDAPTGHTPGPWRYDKGDKDTVVPLFNDDTFEFHGKNNEHIGVCDGEYNARLISAAPELLETCQAVVVGFDRFLKFGPIDMNRGVSIVGMARKSVDKALGKQ